MKIVWVGLEGSGKSLRMAEKQLDILHRNIRWKRKHNIDREIWVNDKLSEMYLQKAKQGNVKVVQWTNLSELVGLQGADLFMDEIGTYFDSRNYQDLSLNVRRWFAQADKSGVSIYATAQDYAQIDIAYRRLVNKVFYCNKIIGSFRPHPSLPKSKLPFFFGIFLEREMDVRADETGEYQFTNWLLIDLIFGLFLLRKKIYSIYSTTSFIKSSLGVPFQHNKRECPECDFFKITHN